MGLSNKFETRSIDIVNPVTKVFGHELGFYIEDSKIYFYEPKIDFDIIKFVLVDCQEPIEDKHWESLKGFILTHLTADEISGDLFGEVVKAYIPEMKLLLKQDSAHEIKGLVFLSEPSYQGSLFQFDNSQLAEVYDFLSSIGGSNTGRLFKISSDKLFALVKFANEKSIEIRLDKTRLKSISSMKFKLLKNINWLELDGEFNIDGEVFNLANFLNKSKIEGNSILLKDGSKALISEDWANKLRKLNEFSNSKDQKINLHLSKALLVSEMNIPNLEQDDSVTTWVDKIKSFQKIESLSAHKTFRGELREYQKFALGWFQFLENLGISGCLADDMGLGKTVQIIAHLQKRILSKKANFPSLIVCPKTLIGNWASEIEKFAPNIKFAVWTGKQFSLKQVEKYDIILSSYPTIQRKVEEFTSENLEFDYIIIDEAQTIKNPNSLTHKAVCSLLSSHRIALSGTPIENHIGELVAIFDFLSPGMFQRKNWQNKDLNLEDLRFLQPFMLRRTKNEVLQELPEKTVQVVCCEPTPPEKKFYKSFSQEIAKSIFNKESSLAKGNSIEILAALTRLRQAACHIGLIDKNFLSEEVGKIERLRSMLSEISEENHKVVIFSQFTSLLKIIREQLGFDETNSCYLDGKSTNRELILEQFRNHEHKKVFFISLKAGGVGLNLTNASYCFLLDPWWNPAVKAQAIDRLHRIGQNNPVHAYRLITKGSIEEKVLLLQDQKKEIIDSALNHNEDFLRKLSKKDLQTLLE